MKKVVFIAILILFAGLSFWYLKVRDYDVRVRFSAQTLPQIVQQTLIIWIENDRRGQIDLIDEAQHVVEQRVQLVNEEYSIKWTIEKGKDSTVQVLAAFNQERSKVSTRVESLFRETTIESAAKAVVTEFYGKLNEHLNAIRVKVVGTAVMEERFCCCVTTQTTQYGKAAGMMRNYPLLGDFIAKNKLVTKGNPLVQVKEWDEEADQLVYDFCFPIEPIEPIAHPEIFFKNIPQQRTVKAIFNGNYISSDRAWYAIDEYARRKKVPLERKPLEVFFNNPIFDNDEENWKAEIYMPFQ